MKAIQLEPGVPAAVRSIAQATALAILKAIHRYAETGNGQVKALKGAFDGLLRLRVGNYRVFFAETDRRNHDSSGLQPKGRLPEPGCIWRYFPITNIRKKTGIANKRRQRPRSLLPFYLNVFSYSPLKPFPSR